MSPWFRWESLETGNFDGGNLHGRNRKTSLQKLPWQKEKVNASLEAGGRGRRKMGLAEESGDVEWLCSRWSDKTLWGKKWQERESGVWKSRQDSKKGIPSYDPFLWHFQCWGREAAFFYCHSYTAFLEQTDSRAALSAVEAGHLYVIQPLGNE